MNPVTYPEDDGVTIDSLDSALVEFSDAELGPAEPVPLTARQWLQVMRTNVRTLGYPLPPGFVRPPGIDFDALLRQVPWPPPSADQHPADDQQQSR